jgi:hypothetical protein
MGAEHLSTATTSASPRNTNSIDMILSLAMPRCLRLRNSNVFEF